MDFSKLLDAVKLHPKHWLAISLVTGFLLFSPLQWRARFGLSEFDSNIRAMIAIAFIASSAMLIAEGVHVAFAGIRGGLDERAFLSRGRRRLQRLTPAERGILARFFANNSRTLCLPINSGVVSGLESARIIYRSSNLGSIDGFDYNIQDWARDYLSMHPELLALDDDSEVPRARSRRPRQ